MSKTVKIPNSTTPYWSCKINTKEYSYLANSTATVPDEVAAVIAEYNASLPKPSARAYNGVLVVDDIKHLTPEECDNLDCGQIVLKKTGNEFHTYVVSYKDEVKGEMSLTYVDHSCSEEAYYDKTEGDWSWIVTDITRFDEAGMENPMTTAGDIIIGGTDGAPTRLAAGSNGQFLVMDSGAPAWVTVPAANGNSF